MSTIASTVSKPLRSEPTLLEDYIPDICSYFCSPKQSLLASPPFANLLDMGLENLADKVNESLRFATDLGHKDPVVVGAISFDSNAKHCLRLSTQCKRTQTKRSDENLTQTITFTQQSQHERPSLTLPIQQVPSPIEFIETVKNALHRFENSELEKVVLSRTLDVSLNKKIDIKNLVSHLQIKNPKAYTFAVKLSDKNLGTLLGASPELLISRKGNKITANPLAGTEPRSSDPQIDKAQAEQLLCSEKDLREHALVIASVVEALKPYCKSLKVPNEPSLISTPTLWHLSTFIEGELIDSETSSLELALAMHPTPAVCGYPKNLAKKAINELEGYNRNMFTGMVGWCDDKGDGEWAVTIRCAEVRKNKIRLYAGAGVVAGSIPEKELAETGAKFNTMLDALNISERV